MQNKTWPSRRLQLGIIVVLAVGAALQVFLPPLTREGRAEKLYNDSWFIGRKADVIEEIRPGRADVAIKKLEAALKLSPGNSLYEQALVLQCPKDKLPQLLKTHKFGLKAKRFAAGFALKKDWENWQPSSRIAVRAPIPGMPPLPGTPGPTHTDPDKLLKRLHELSKLDPTNGLPHYQKAGILQRLGRTNEALAEVKAGNACAVVEFYTPSVTDTILNSLMSSVFIDIDFTTSARMRDTARFLTDTANDRLRRGRVDEARTILEDCCRMGVKYATAEPHTIITFLVGKAIFSIGKKDLDPLYRDFGMNDRLEALKQTDAAFERGIAQTKRHIDGSMDRLMTNMLRPLAEPFHIGYSAGTAANLLVLLGLFWIPAAVRRRGHAALTLAPWSEGWLARMFLAVYIPVFAVFLALVMVGAGRYSELLGEYGQFGDTFYVAISVLIGICQLVLIAIALKSLHRRYDEQTGERTSIFRFIFKAPAAAKAWTRKYLATAMAAQIVFLGCCFLILTIIYEPIVGAHPWQIGRFRVTSISAEQALVRSISTELQATGFAQISEK